MILKLEDIRQKLIRLADEINELNGQEYIIIERRKNIMKRIRDRQIISNQLIEELFPHSEV